jgi:hypothetical protein
MTVLVSTRATAVRSTLVRAGTSLYVALKFSSLHINTGSVLMTVVVRSEKV